MLSSKKKFIIPGILPASEALLLNDVYLVVLYANRIPPHLALSVSGKLCTLTVKGATIDGEMKALLALIRRRSIESLFIRLSVPPLFTLDELHAGIKKYTLAYPRVDIGKATCLSPIRDFCSGVYETEITQVNFVYELLPKLYEQGVITSCYQLNLQPYTVNNSFALNNYTMNDIFEGMRNPQNMAL